MTVWQTSCRHCQQDIEGFYPFTSGKWRDRGNNTHCPTPAGDAGQVHEPPIGQPAIGQPAPAPKKPRAAVYTLSVTVAVNVDPVEGPDYTGKQIERMIYRELRTFDRHNGTSSDIELMSTEEGG